MVSDPSRVGPVTKTVDNANEDGKPSLDKTPIRTCNKRLIRFIVNHSCWFKLKPMQLYIRVYSG